MAMHQIIYADPRVKRSVSTKSKRKNNMRAPNDRPKLGNNTRLGVWASGSSPLGYTYVRLTLARLLSSEGPKWVTEEEVPRYQLEDTLRALTGDRTETAWEEFQALDWLNEMACEEDVYFDILDGNLVLLPDETAEK